MIINDVFISYSRRDYVDGQGNILPDSPVQYILDFLRENGISYWFDKEGIYSSNEFTSVLAKAISESRMVLFVSSMHSNESPYTAGEIKEALDTHKPIVIVKIDDYEYSDKFRCLINTLDFIDYSQVDAMQRLLVSIRKTKAETEKQELAQCQQADEAKRQIKGFVNSIEGLRTQKDTYLKEIYSRLRQLTINNKRCPVCGVTHKLNTEYCHSCGWYFTTLSDIKLDGKELVEPTSSTRLTLARNKWESNPVATKLTLKQIIMEHKPAMIITVLSCVALLFMGTYLVTLSARAQVNELSSNLQQQINLSKHLTDTMNALIHKNFIQQEIIEEKERIIESYLKDVTFNIPFLVGKTELDFNNDTEAEFKQKIDEVKSYNGTLVSIEIIHAASPEGNLSMVSDLAKARSKAFGEVLKPHFGDVEIKVTTKIHTWMDVADILKKQGHIKEANIIYAMDGKSHDEINIEIRKNQTLYELVRTILPELRYTKCKFKMVHSSYAK